MSKKIWIFIIPIGILIVIIIGFLVIRNRTQAIYEEGIEAYNSFDVDSAVENFSRMEGFPILLGSFKDDSSHKYTELREYQSARSLWLEGSYDESLVEYDLILQKYPASPHRSKYNDEKYEIILEYAREEQENGNFGTAIKLLDKVISDKDSPEILLDIALDNKFDVYLEYGNQLVQQEEFKAAVERYTYVYESNSDNEFERAAKKSLVTTMFLWGKAHLENSEYDEAIDKFNHIIDQWPEESLTEDAKYLVEDSFYTRSENLKTNNEPQESIDMLKTLISWQEKYNPDSISDTQKTILEYYIEFGDELLVANEFSDAIDHYATALEISVDLQNDSISRDLYDRIANANLQWANYLDKSNDTLEAGAKYVEIMNEYSDTQAYYEIPVTAANSIYQYGISLLESKDYIGSEYVFTNAMILLEHQEDDDQELRGKIAFSSATLYWMQEYYDEALEQIELARENTTDPDLLIELDQTEEDIIFGWSHQESPSNDKLMNEYVESVCKTGEPIESSLVGLAENDTKVLFMEGEIPWNPQNLLPDRSDISWSQKDLPEAINARYPAHLKYAACAEKTERRYSCLYIGEDGYFISYRVQDRWLITVYDALNGRRIEQKEFLGSNPEACPLKAIDLFSSENSVLCETDTGEALCIYGAEPSYEEIIEWLEKYGK
jgi:tetratricopeptide (TPR) repeat protein